MERGPARLPLRDRSRSMTATRCRFHVVPCRAAGLRHDACAAAIADAASRRPASGPTGTGRSGTHRPQLPLGWNGGFRETTTVTPPSR